MNRNTSFSLTWPAAVQILWGNKNVFTREQFPQDFSVHKHGRRVIVCFAQNGRRDVMCERSFLQLTSVVTFCNSVKVTLLTDVFALWSIGHWDCQADESLHQSNCETTESKLLQSSLIRSIRLVHVVRIKTKMLPCDTLWLFVEKKKGWVIYRRKWQVVHENYSYKYQWIAPYSSFRFDKTQKVFLNASEDFPYTAGYSFNFPYFLD